MEFISLTKAILTAILLFGFSFFAYSQTKIDSLNKLLQQSEGRDKYTLLIQLSRETLMVDPDASFKFAWDALKTANSLKDNSKIAEANHCIGLSKGRIGDNLYALKHFNLAIEYYKKAGNLDMAIYTTNDLAGLNVNLKRYDIALSLYNEILSYYSKNNMTGKYCSVLNNVGLILYEKGDFDKALENYFKAMDLITKLKPDDKGFLAILHCNMGEAYFGKKDYSASLKYRRLSLDYFEKAKDLDGVANLQMDAGASFMKLKDYKNAKLYLDSALVNYTSIKYPGGIRKTKKLTVELYMVTNQLENALLSCSELDRLSTVQKDSSMLVECYKYYSDIYLAKGDYKLSALNFKKYIDLKEIIDSKENKQRMFELQTVFQTEEQEFENKTLRQENELQREKLNSKESLLIAVSIGVVVSVIFLLTLVRKEKKIRRINEQIQDQNKYLESHLVSKDKFFSILAHNLKNPFWAVLGQNKMLEDEYDDLTEKERKELIKGIGSSAGNVYKLFEDLLKWAKSQQNTIEVEKEKVNIRNLVKSSIRPYELIAENKKIKLEVNVREEIEIEVDKFMMETVIGNLVDNAIKFSLQEDSVIVSGYRVGEEIEIMVQDYGMGISREKLEKLFKIDEDISTAGTMNERGTGLGLIICKEFVEKHGGRICVDSLEGRGTTFSIFLPAIEKFI